MLGQLLFGETPIALIGQPPYVEDGWIKVCADGSQQAQWVKQDRNNVDTIDCGYVPTNWSPVK